MWPQKEQIQNWTSVSSWRVGEYASKWRFKQAQVGGFRNVVPHIEHFEAHLLEWHQALWTSNVFGLS